MIKCIPLLGIAASVLLSSGCVVSIGSHRPNPSPPPSPVVLPSPPANPAEAATMAEIGAAAQLSVHSSRLDALQAIARRGDLSPAAQVHLVNIGYRCLGIEKSRVALLTTLIQNPAFSDHARHAIVSQLNQLSIDSSRRAILKQLDRRAKEPKRTVQVQ